MAFGGSSAINMALLAELSRSSVALRRARNIGRNLLCFLQRPSALEFRPESADAFWAGARHPAKTRAEEFVLCFAFEAAAEGFLVEMAKLLGGSHPFGKSFGKGGALTPGEARAVEAGDGVPADVSLWVKGPIGGDVDHCPVGRDVHSEFEQERVIVLHAIEVPAQAERIECSAENIVTAAHVYRKRRAEVALGAHGSADDTLVVAVGLDIEGGFEARPLAAKLWIGVDGEFVLRIFGLGFDKVFVSAFLDVEFVAGHSSADGFVRWFRQQLDEETVPGVQASSLFQSSQAILQHILDIKRPERCWDEHPAVKPAQRLNIQRVEIPSKCQFSLLTLLDAPDFTRLATGNPKAGRPCHPGAAETVETPGGTLSWVRDTPRTGVPGPNSPAEPTKGSSQSTPPWGA